MLLSIMALLRGKVYSLFSPSPEKEQTPKSPGCLHQGRFVDFLDDLGAGWDVEGTALLREARRRRAPTATGRLRPGPRAAVAGASRLGRRCWIASVSAVLPRTAGQSPRWCRRTAQPAWEMGASRKCALSAPFISARLSQRWRSWTTMVDIAFPRDRAVTLEQSQ